MPEKTPNPKLHQLLVESEIRHLTGQALEEQTWTDLVAASASGRQLLALARQEQEIMKRPEGPAGLYRVLNREVHWYRGRFPPVRLRRTMQGLFLHGDLPFSSAALAPALACDLKNPRSNSVRPENNVSLAELNMFLKAFIAQPHRAAWSHSLIDRLIHLLRAAPSYQPRDQTDVASLIRQIAALLGTDHRKGQENSTKDVLISLSRAAQSGTDVEALWDATIALGLENDQHLTEAFADGRMGLMNRFIPRFAPLRSSYEDALTWSSEHRDGLFWKWWVSWNVQQEQWTLTRAAEVQRRCEQENWTSPPTLVVTKEETRPWLRPPPRDDSPENDEVIQDALARFPSRWLSTYLQTYHSGTVQGQLDLTGQVT